MKKAVKIIFILLIFISIDLSTVSADIVDYEEFNQGEIEEQITEASNNLSDFPTINSRRFVVFDRVSKQVLYGKNENVKGAMASTTKIMTCIVVLENENLDKEVTVSAKAAGTGGSRLGLKKNDKITVKDLLYGLMLKSGNDAAIALAEDVSGSVENFSELMNEKAKELNLNSTHFVTPHGLDNSEHYTTAVELAKIADYAMQNETFAKIVGTKMTTIKINNSEKVISNTNELLGNLNGVIGIKTGFTNNAGRCLVTETKRGDMDIIAVVLGADTKKYRTKDSVNLIEYTYSNYDLVDLNSKILEEFEKWKNINLKRIQVIKGKKENVNIRLGEPQITKMAVKRDDIDKIKIEINCITTFEAPVSPNLRMGTLNVYINEKLIESLEIFTAEQVERKQWNDYFLDLIKNFMLYNEQTLTQNINNVKILS